MSQKKAKKERKTLSKDAMTKALKYLRATHTQGTMELRNMENARLNIITQLKEVKSVIDEYEKILGE